MSVIYPFNLFQSTHSLWSATRAFVLPKPEFAVSIHALLVECDLDSEWKPVFSMWFQSTHSLWSATSTLAKRFNFKTVSIHALLVECDRIHRANQRDAERFNPRTPCGVRRVLDCARYLFLWFQSTHSLWSATAPDLIHCYSTEQIILCANLPKKTVIARLLFLSIYLSIFYSQCITPIADLPGNSCELEVGAQAMFNSL